MGQQRVFPLPGSVDPGDTLLQTQLAVTNALAKPSQPAAWRRLCRRGGDGRRRGSLRCIQSARQARIGDVAMQEQQVSPEGAHGAVRPVGAEEDVQSRVSPLSVVASIEGRWLKRAYQADRHGRPSANG